jgi:hypothetical protein
MEDKVVEGIEELHERFLETGWRIPIPGRHPDKPVKLEEFRLHAARAGLSPERPLISPRRSSWSSLGTTFSGTSTPAAGKVRAGRGILRLGAPVPYCERRGSEPPTGRKVNRVARPRLRWRSRRCVGGVSATLVRHS